MMDTSVKKELMGFRSVDLLGMLICLPSVFKIFVISNFSWDSHLEQM